MKKGDLERISSTNYYWKINSDHIVIEQRRRWYPAILCGLLMAYYTYISLEINMEEEITRQILLVLIMFSPWVLFNVLTPVKMKVFKNSIVYHNPIWRKKQIQQRIIRFDLLSERVGGRLPHQEIQVVAILEHSDPFTLMAIKKYGVEEKDLAPLSKSLNGFIGVDPNQS